MKGFWGKVPGIRKLKAMQDRIQQLERQLQEITKEQAIHGEAIGNAKQELAIHGEAIGNAQKEISIHGEAIGNMQTEVATHGKAIGEDRQQINKVVEEMCLTRAGLNELKRVKNTGNIQTENADERVSSQVVSSNEYYSIDYFDFENHFRGSREIIMERQKVYLPYFEGCKNVLDVGCGRGEFLQLLISQGIGATGIDLYEPYVEYVKMQGLPCELGDANEYMRKAKQVDGVFLGQVVEHLTASQIIELVTHAYEALIPGQYLIMETPNPMTLSIFSHAFYMDPSHEKPVHPYTLKYIAEKAGFSSVEILFTECSRMENVIPSLEIAGVDTEQFNQAMKQLSEDLYGSQDYAVIARK